MQILVLIYEYPPIGGGGGRIAQDICKELVRKGHNVKVITAHWGDLPLEEFDEGIQVQRVRSGRVVPFKAGFKTMAGFILCSILPALKMIRSWKPDIMHVHFAVPSGAAAWVVSLLSGQRYVLTAHLGDVPGGVPEKTGRWFRWIFPFTRPIWQRASRVVAVSGFTRELALKNYPVQIDVIHNGVDLQELDPGEIQVNHPPRIAFAGRFMTQKNPLHFIQILSQLKDLPWNCIMMGDGPLRAEIEREIAAHQLQERITLTGWVTPVEVVDWFQKSDILFMPSLSEGLPVVGVHALSMGLALVLSRVGGCVDLVKEDFNGFLVDREDTAGFEKSLRFLLSNSSKLLEFRQNSRLYANHFDIRTITGQYEEIFQNVINNAN